MQMETLETSGGNTKTPESSSSLEKNGDLETNTKFRSVPGKRWCFTAWEIEGDALKAAILSDTVVLYYVMGNEICPNTQRPHVQGFIQTHDKIRPEERWGTRTTHWEKTKKTNEQNYMYCRKIRDGDTANTVWVSNMTVKLRKPILDPMQGLTPFAWQAEIIEICKGAVDDRKIYWYWESGGCTGKSTLTKHLVMKYNAYSVLGKGADIKCGLAVRLETQDVDIVIYDIPRVQKNCVSYSSIEEIKNGLMYSTKYESGMCIFNPPHIIIFANEHPKLDDTLSSDRWVIVKIDKTGS